MKRPHLTQLATIAAYVVVLSLSTAPAWAVEPRPETGALPGFPRERGVVPIIGSPSAMAAHEQQVDSALSAARAEGKALEPNPDGVTCPIEPYAFIQDVCYQGGPVLRKPVVHLIFWLGPNIAGIPTTGNVHQFPSLYRSTIERYFADVAHDKGVSTDTYAVDPQYHDAQPGVNESEFTASNATLDAKAFPVHSSGECPGAVEGVAEGPCVLDSDIQREVELTAGTSTAGLGNIYFVFTAPGVSSCAHLGCSYTTYCAYHGDFGGNGVTSGNQTIYANMPYAVPEVCDSGIHPNEERDEGTDGAIDVASHEFNEAVTDPIGSQCKSVAKKECELLSWTDIIGQEIADKCQPPETTIAGLYGGPLGKTAFQSGYYNQLINGHPYWTQTEWSNTAGIWSDASQSFEGHCVQRVLPTAFVLPTEAKATVPAVFDGSSSGEVADPVKDWVWSFGDGVRASTTGAKASHTYSQPGTYTVTLTAFDAYGNSNSSTSTVSVGAAPPLPPAPEPIVLTKNVNVLVPVEPTAYTASQLASKLGLPANGARLSGLRPIAIGHAECPPACTVTVRMYAIEHVTVHRHHMVKRVFIGALTTKVAAKGSSKLTLTLNAAGRKLLRRSHKLAAQLLVSVTGKEGGSWQMSRKVTLTR